MKLFTQLLLILSITYAYAATEPVSVRWTGKEDTNPNILHILETLKQKTGVALSVTDLTSLESRTLATSHFLMLNQVNGGIPVQGQNIRIWTELKSGNLIQLEARIAPPGPARGWSILSAREALPSEKTMELTRNLVRSRSEDPFIRDVSWKDFWVNGVLTRIVSAKGKRGKHTIHIGIEKGQILSSSYEEFPQADLSVPARVYPIYEEVEEGKGTILPRIDSELRYLKNQVQRIQNDPYAPLRNVHYLDSKWNPLLGLTEQGRKDGFWSMGYLLEQGRQLTAGLPYSANSFANGGIILDGRYATVSLHPDAKKLQNLSFTPGLSRQLFPMFVPSATDPEHEEMLPIPAILGRPITSLDDAWMRPARRLADHDPASYINDGFDELQVYWSVTQMFESLRPMGFTDPDLSSRPFNAFLFNPDISYRDNAFYTDDTINFTTYSAKTPNMARDNTTIWHELGHGVMDRLMGDFIQLADTGGLSEGMADFIAQLVLNDVTGGLTFDGKSNMRIFNNTGFYLTNEVHDDGEAYGGAMNDLLQGAMARFGRNGLIKVTDLTLEAMRLTRNHPGLTAVGWFEHMLFADERGSAVRSAGELKPFIMGALNNRNFVFGNDTPATIVLKNGNDEVTSDGPGSRPRPIKLSLKESETQSYQLSLQVKSSPIYHFKFPVRVEVDFKTGALQGGIHWTAEEQNPLKFTLASETDTLTVPLTVTGKCDEINRPDKSCVDYAYVKVFSAGGDESANAKPNAKKRFYLRIYPQ